MRHWLAAAPAAAFFGAYLWTRDFAFATKALLAAAALQIAAMLLFRAPPRAAEWLAAALVFAFGGASLLLGDSEYLKIKTTVVNWLFALFLLLSDFVFKKNIARALLDEAFAARDAQWRRASNFLALLFFAVGAANLAAIRRLSEEEWVWTKTFVYPAVSFAGFVAVAAYLATRAAVKHDGR